MVEEGFIRRERLWERIEKMKRKKVSPKQLVKELEEIENES